MICIVCLSLSAVFGAFVPVWVLFYVVFGMKFICFVLCSSVGLFLIYSSVLSALLIV